MADQDNAILRYEQSRPVYRKGRVPEGLATAAQLRAARRSPAGLEPAAWLYYSRIHHRICPLYRHAEARPIRALTDRQRAALAAGRELAGTIPCHVCRTVRVGKSRFDEPICEHCEVVRERAKQRRFDDDRIEAAQWARTVLADPETVFLDLETTGLGAAFIVELAVIDGSGKPLLDTLVNPLIPIPDEAAGIHGISDEMVRSAPTFADLLTELTNVLAGRRAIIYNAEFDTTILRTELDRYFQVTEPMLEIEELTIAQSRAPHPSVRTWMKSVRAECAMQWHAQWYGDWNDYWGDYTWQPLGGGHRAIDDCQTLRERILAMAETPTPHPADQSASSAPTVAAPVAPRGRATPR